MLVIDKLNVLISAYNSNFGSATSKDKETIFARWYFKNYDHYNLDDDEIDDLLTGGKNDRGIDSFYYDEDRNLLNIYQFKYKNSGVKIDTEIEDFAMLALNLCQKNYQRTLWMEANCKYLSPILANLLTQDLNYKFIFVSTFDRQTIDELNIKYIDYCEKIESLDSIEFIGSEQMLDRQKESPTTKLISMFDKKDSGGQKDMFEIRDSQGKIKALVKNLSGLDIVDKFSDESCFDSNVRIYLGDKGINGEMKVTALSSPDKFWFYNNGITIICNKIEQKLGNFHLKNPQVVNGAQTINSLKRIKYAKDGREQLKKLSVLAKVIEIEEDDATFFSNIVRYTNKQNKIDLWQFLANEPAWKILRKEIFNSSEKTIDFVYKTGLTKKLPGTYDLKLNEFINIVLSYNGFPHTVKAGQTKIFKDYESENSIFKKNFSDNFLKGLEKEELYRKYAEKVVLLTRIYKDDKKFAEKEVQKVIWTKSSSTILRGIDTLTKHSKPFFLSLLSKIKPENIEDIEYLQKVYSKLPIFYEECINKILVPVWEKLYLEDKTRVNNVTKVAKATYYYTEINERLKNMKIKIDIEKLLC